MPIMQLANSSDISSMQLISHAQTIKTTLRDKAVESRQLSGLVNSAGELGKSLMDSVKKAQKDGAQVIVCDDPERAELDVKRVIKMLKESSSTLFDVSRRLGNDARAYENQMTAHDHLMTGVLSFAPLKVRVATCERQAISLMNRQKAYLQSIMTKIEEAEMESVGFEGMLGRQSRGLQVKHAAQRLMDSL